MTDKILELINAAKAKVEDQITKEAQYKLEAIYKRKEQAKKILKGIELEEKMFLAELEEELG